MGCQGSKQKAQKPAAEGDKTLLQQKAGEGGKKAENTSASKKALIVTTSASMMGDHKTGAWSEEICGPFYAFQDAGIEVTICSISGGDVPIDDGSLTDQFKTENDKKMIESGSGPLKGTLALATQDASSFDIIFFAGGHGTCVDFPTDAVGQVVADAFASGKIVAAVCHGSMAFANAKTADGEPFVKGKTVTCFTDAEEEQVGLNEKVPFLLESKLKELGAVVETSAPWSDKVVQDGNLVTGQNPQSSVSCAKLSIALATQQAVEKVVEPTTEAVAEQTTEAPQQGADQAAEQEPEKLEALMQEAVEKVEESPVKEAIPAEPVVIETDTKTTVCC